MKTPYVQTIHSFQMNGVTSEEARTNRRRGDNLDVVLKRWPGYRPGCPCD